MVVYTLEQRWEILRNYFENHGNVADCVRKLRKDFGRRKAPSVPNIRYLVKEVKETGKTVRTPENIAAVAEKVCVKRHQHQFTVVLNN